MTGHALPADDDIRTAADELLAQHRAGGTYPSVSALAKTFHINRTTFYRHYAAIASAMLDSAAQQSAEGPKRRRPPTPTVTRLSSASAPKTPTYDVTSKSTKNRSAC